MKLRLVSFAVMLPALLPGQALAQSYDCGKATTEAEIAVCNSGQLADADIELARLYKNALEVTSSRSALKAEQREWISQRDNCGADDDCLVGAYKRRIDELQLILDGQE